MWLRVLTSRRVAIYSDGDNIIIIIIIGFLVQGLVSLFNGISIFVGYLMPKLFS